MRAVKTGEMKFGGNREFRRVFSCPGCQVFPQEMADLFSGNMNHLFVPESSLLRAILKV